MGSLNENTNYNEYLIKTQELNFHIEDTIIETNICIQPDGFFYFIDSIEKTQEYETVSLKVNDDSVIYYKEKIVPKSQEILTLLSSFPPLIIHDSSVINHYDFPDEWNFGFAYEMEYSNIIKNLKEIKIKKSKYDTEIRIIMPINDYGFLNYQPRIYSSIRLKIDNGQGIIYYSEGYYDSLANFNLTKKDSSIINFKQLTKTNKVIQNIEFDKEYYFTEIGLYVSEMYLIEIKLNDNYFVFERGLLNNYRKNKQLNDLYYNLVGLKMKYLE